MNMASEIEKYKCKFALLESRLKESEETVQTLLKINNEPRVRPIFESPLESDNF